MNKCSIRQFAINRFALPYKSLRNILPRLSMVLIR